MAKLVLTNASISIGGTDVSTSVASVQIETSAEEVETTAFGSVGKTRVGGLLDTTVNLSMHNDYSAIEGLVYTMTALVTGWNPINGAVGELNTVDVSWPVSGTITKAVA
jgi:hypothetical protein